eukprot:s197_g21.t1
MGVIGGATHLSILLSLVACCSSEQDCANDVISHLQVEQGRKDISRMAQSSTSNRSKRTSRTVVQANHLYWQGYGNPLWSYFIGLVGRDRVNFGSVVGHANVGLNMMGNAPMGNMFDSVTSDSGILGLVPGCFSDKCRGPEDYDDLLTTLAREGKMERAFTMCFNDGSEGGGQLYLGKPEVPPDAITISMAPLTGPSNSYSPLSTFESNEQVEFFFGDAKVGSQKAEEWNNMMLTQFGYSDTGTAGLELPVDIFVNVANELQKSLQNGLANDRECAILWESMNIVDILNGALVNEGAVNCAKPFLRDFKVKLGPGVSLSVPKASLFYETAPCSKKYGISWRHSNDGATRFGSALNFGQTLLYDSSDLASPKMVVLGPANGCTRDYSAAPGAKPIPMAGLPGQVLGGPGTITANLHLGSPGQEITVQLDTGSQKLMGIHQTCRNLGNCFMVQPVNKTAIALVTGSDVDQPQCITQTNDLFATLKTHGSCDFGKHAVFCDCGSREDCFSMILQAASKSVVPNQICALQFEALGLGAPLPARFVVTQWTFTQKARAPLSLQTSRVLPSRSLLGSNRSPLNVTGVICVIELRCKPWSSWDLDVDLCQDCDA